MVTLTKTEIQKRIDKSRSLGGAARVTEVAPNRYSVLSSNDRDFYRVAVISHRWICNCMAGQSERACWHLAAVWEYRMGIAMGAPGRPALPQAPDFRNTPGQSARELWG